ncbi:hypothetical protein HYZ98_00300 [Candidatus Peregrinibacteria bacterium]|nr:hypothetical protein [Candidatus Peregrinibacteria bacterium]
MDQLLIALTIAAGISPLLTFTHLWQLKEWRIDRLREHLRAEGILRPLFGILRPTIILSSFAISYILHFLPAIALATAGTFSILASLILLTALNILQITVKKQKYPVWTSKAITLATTSLLLTAALSLYIHYSTFDILLILLPLLQPFFLLLTWLLWLPVDHMLKCHTLEEARALRAEYPDLTVIGITGSVGKTTTKTLLAHILSDFHPLVTPAYVNTEMGVAQWLIKNAKCKMQNVKLLIVEMGAYRKGEIRTLCDIVQPTIGIITCIGKQHLGLFGSEQEIADAKGELCEALPENGHAFINATTPFVEQLKEKTKCPMTLVQPQIPFSSIALAVAVAKHFGLSEKTIEEKCNSFTPPPHTFSMRVESGITILDDTHNVSPESFHAAIQWAKSQPQKHKVLMTPGIIELGNEDSLIHEQLGETANPVFDRVIFLNKRHAKMFQRGYGKFGEGRRVEIYSKTPPPVPQGALLVCIGRMSDTIIQNILP